MYTLLVVSVCAASFNSLLLNRSKLARPQQIFYYNLLGVALWCILLFLFNGFKIYIDWTVAFWGMLYGVIQTLFLWAKTSAMSTGPVSITTLVGNCSMPISIIVSFILWQEPATIFDILGLIVLMGGIFLSTYHKDSTPISRKWKWYTVFFFLFSAGVGLVFKAYSKSGNPSNATDMMFVSAIVMLFLYSVILSFVGNWKIKQLSISTFIANWNLKQVSDGHIGKFICFSLISGFSSCLYNRLNVTLSGELDAIIFFPVFNGGVILLSAILGMVIGKEKTTIRQKIGLGVGIIGIVIIGIL